MDKIPLSPQDIATVEAQIQYHFCKPFLLAQAFIHRSYVNENRLVTVHNERLEFLGDSILGMLVADYLYQRLPDTPEGELSALRSRLVEASSCVLYLIKLRVDRFLLLGRGERLNEGRGRESIIADLFEALIGAIYLDGGMEAAKQFFFGNFCEEIDQLLGMPWDNWKAQLQDWCQKYYRQTPRYSVTSQTGPDHSKLFHIAVLIDNKELGYGVGSSKKEAQQAAAAAALASLKALPQRHESK